MKRGELSMEVIIIAAIALLVLVIISYLVIRSGGTLDRGTKCEALGKGAVCSTSCDSGYVRSANACANADEICCVPLSASS